MSSRCLRNQWIFVKPWNIFIYILFLCNLLSWPSVAVINFCSTVISAFLSSLGHCIGKTVWVNTCLTLLHTHFYHCSQIHMSDCRPHWLCTGVTQVLSVRIWTQLCGVVEFVGNVCLCLNRQGCLLVSSVVIQMLVFGEMTALIQSHSGHRQDLSQLSQ